METVAIAAGDGAGTVRATACVRAEATGGFVAIGRRDVASREIEPVLGPGVGVRSAIAFEAGEETFAMVALLAVGVGDGRPLMIFG